MDEKAEYRQQVREQKRIDGEINAAISALLEHSNGRELLWWLLTITKIGQQPWQMNALAASFNCGELNVGLQLWSRIMEVNPAGYVRMMQEKADGRRSDNGDSDAGDGD